MAKSVAVVGASGYSGAELVRIILGHQELELTAVFANSSSGEKLATIHPQFQGVDFDFQDISELSLNSYDLVFFALPAGVSGKLLKDKELKAKYVDLGADFRLLKKEDWEQFYPGKYSGVWTYGLPELKNQRKSIAKSNTVANPGCYATAAALSLLPAIEGEALFDATINIVAASGTTGAGRNLRANLLNSEANNNLSPYKVGGIHQHIPEIEQTINFTSNKDIKISFIPILAPMPRGILLTSTFRSDFKLNSLFELYADYFRNELFVKVLNHDEMPNTRAVLGSNGALLAVFKDERTNFAQVIVSIDNLGKGAAGQAVQNANLMLNFPEGMGLTSYGLGS